MRRRAVTSDDRRIGYDAVTRWHCVAGGVV